jgi:hypothetical protein
MTSSSAASPRTPSNIARRTIASLLSWLRVSDTTAAPEEPEKLSRLLRDWYTRFQAIERLSAVGLEQPAKELIVSAVASLLAAKTQWPALASRCDPAFAELGLGADITAEGQRDALDAWAEKLASPRKAAFVIERALRPMRLSMLPWWQRRALQAYRTLAALCVVASVLAMGWYFFGPREVATASASWGILYPPWAVTDRDLDSNWVLPDGALGWIELTIPSRTLRSMRMWNVQKEPNYATARIAIDVFDGDRLVHTEEQDISATAHARSSFHWVPRTPFPATRVRIHVRAFLGLGGGFSQIQVNP